VPANFSCDLSRTGSRVHHAWQHAVGGSRALLALRADWQQQLRRCRKELGFQYVRFHGLLDDSMGTLITHQDKFLYSFLNTDRIFDFLVGIGMRPFVELGFMPATLASGGATVFSYRANITPPTDYSQWAGLIRKLVTHWVGRYGIEEVRQWLFEVWNEPNLPAFWTGTQKDYFELYARTAQAIKTVDSQLQVGGPATAMNAWVEELLAYCKQNGVPADFVSTHIYPTDPLGFEGANTEEQLANSPPHLMRDHAKLTYERAAGRPVYYTEWNISSNPRDHYHDEPFAAAYAIKTIMETDEFVEGYSFWTFTDIFDENYFPSVPFHGGFGLLNLYGVPKPIYRAFQLLSHLGAAKLAVDGMHETVDAWVIRKESSVSVLLTNHAQPRQVITNQLVRVALANSPKPCVAYVERVDQEHANPQKAWLQMGSPTHPSALQVEQLESASRVVIEPVGWRCDNGTIQVDVDLPPHGVAAITIEFASANAR
jgi:xylan 1,4-beta-xylosidase